MAEIKNSFLSSKMNKDLDDRLIPNGEYRDALNVSIGKSENSDIGTLQNILGNSIIGGENTITGLECIGYYMDNTNNRIYQFLTNAGDNDPDPIYHQITVYDFSTNEYTVLVEGAFLNFSKSFQITGVNLLENLLYWTDYNNQPRKINIQSALNAPAYSAVPYYTNEDHISVAKYAPVEAMSMYKKFVTTNTAIVTTSPIIPVADASGIVEGMTLLADSPTPYTSNEFIFVESVVGTNVTVSGAVTLPINTELTFLISTMTNESDEANWPGDPAYLKPRYVRFSYRFRLDDGEYTLMAPFTQIAFIPNQKGYFINGDETEAYTSTVLNWFENNVNNIQLLVPFPDLTTNVTQSYKIQALDILYKESDAQTVKVLDTILSGQFAQNTLGNSNIYAYDYQSKKPYKTLPPDQITRVYDIVPVRAKAQETISNRIVYGNFISGYTAPASLNYQVSVNQKQDYSYNFIEYPNHTVKQNRTYQVGFVLADKYGRQSSVILSSLDTSATVIANVTYGGSTVYSPYYSYSDIPSIKDWYGNAISVLVNNPVVSSYNQTTGEPGLYAESTSTTGFTLTGTTTITDTTYDFEISAGTPPNQYEYLRGAYTDYVRVESITEVSAGVYNSVTSGRVNDLYERSIEPGVDDIKYVYTINPLGWYSYKIVVRQQEQDYYNVYLPGFLDGYPAGQTYGTQVVYDPTSGNATTVNGINTTTFPTTESGIVAHTVLINDNINKIPRDLVEVGPDQKLYRSSVQLFGRVENTIAAGIAGNTQYYPSKKADTAIAIATASELSFLPATVENTLGSATYNFYQLESDPLVARISTVDHIGVIGVQNVSSGGPTPTFSSDPNNMLPFLSIYETKPDYSLLDIFWETSTSGLISDLNADVLTGSDGANGISEINWSTFTEDLNPNDPVDKFITNYFYPISNTGNPVDSTSPSISVFNASNPSNPITGVFALESTYVPGLNPYWKYRIYVEPNQFQVFRNDVNLNNYTFVFSFIQANQTATTSYNLNAKLINIAPTIVDNALNPISGPINLYLTNPITTGVPIYTLYGKNGALAYSQILTDLRWRINNTGSTVGWQNYFNIVTSEPSKEGQLLQTAALNPLQTVTLNVELQDAMSSSGVPANGSGVYGSLADNITINIQLATTPPICGRTWTSRNYDSSTYQDPNNTPIPYIDNATDWANATTGAWCWPNFDPVLGEIYGKLYNGYAIKGIWGGGGTKQFAPTGWRIPFYLESCVLSCTNGTHMKSLVPAPGSANGWEANIHTGDNSTGFSAVPAGYMDQTGTWIQSGSNGKIAIFHMDSPTGPTPVQESFMVLYGNLDAVQFDSESQLKWGLSVRFIDNSSVTRTATRTSPGICTLQYNDMNHGNPHFDVISQGQTETFTACSACTIISTCTIT